ncbi:hypothetical protein ACJMK2_037884 [Sinanodonta woodiana]|uniref:Nesprin-1 spectrin repeats region domain-containing protein n=1 Tax=Sinanodonta woodiana TaxID=1069815 RepID=A0ABD3WM80_SINWO
MEGEPKVKNIIALAEKVLPNTAPQGKDIIVRETEALRADWEAFVTALQKTKRDLENCMDQWKEFDNHFERCNAWLKDIETKTKDTELKSSLKEKQTQLEKLKALQKDLVSKQREIDSLSDSAQDLVRVSTDTRVASQSSQMTTKYQTLAVNLKELCRRWEQYVLDHQAYESSFKQCKNWIHEMRNKLSAHSDVSGDKRLVQERIQKLQNLNADKEEGLHMLQIALDNLQIVLPNTSVAGRDNIRREMQGLQAEYDALSGDLNETRNKLEGTLAQWTTYDSSIEQLSRWLRDLENQIMAERQLQNTLQEKKLQLERVKVLQLNIASQQSAIDNLNDKAQMLKEASNDTNLMNQIRQIVERYRIMCLDARELQSNCEKYVRDHQLYRDSYMGTSEWLSATMDKMSTCSDVRGDRSTIEAQLQKVADIISVSDAGREKLDDTLAKGDIVLPETSAQGQELIREELNMLTNDFEGFETDITELQNMLEKLRDDWLMYEEQYEELNQWIKDTESNIRAEAELKATLEEKTGQLEKQNAVHEEVMNQQTKFDELAEGAQGLVQSTTDNRLTSQLTQLSSRYSALIAASKEYLKRYDQHVQDHHQYAETFTEAVTWLQTTRDKLSVCADTSGDRYTIQIQLEKLQEFVVLKEEGQLLIHTAQTWGEKTMNNTSVEGREMIRQELQQLQQEWDALIGETTDTKVMLESCLLQWTDFSDSYEQIQKWLRDTEKRLKISDPKVDLSEKKAELQRIKGVYQDVTSYEQMMEGVGAKAQDLMQKSPASKATTDTSQIITKYHNLKDLAMDMLAKAEQCVAQHQAYLDACNGFVSWLRTAREKLSTCSDTFGEKSAIVGKIERAKALVASLGEGSQRLTEATKAGEATIPNTSASGQTKIRQELKSMSRDFEEYRTELMQAQEELEDCLACWNEFEESYQHFNKWLKETETYLRTDLDLKATAEEKKRHWEQYQKYMDEVQAHQTSLDKVNEKAQKLVQTNADAKTSHAITQLTTRYQGVIALSKDIVKNLEAYYTNHLNYKQNQDDFNSWLIDTKRMLQTIHRTAGSKDDLGTKLDKVAEMQAAMDRGHNHLRAVLDSSEKILPNTNSRGCQTIRQDTETAKVEYENLLTDISQAKRGLETALSHWGDFDRAFEQFHSWLTDMESKLRGEPEHKADLPEKKSNLEKFKAIQADITAHRDLLERLEDKSSQINDPQPQSRVADMRTHYQALSNAARDTVLKLDNQVQGHEEYRKAYIGCLDWMANTRHRLQRLSDYSGDKRTLQDRLQQVKDFKGEMRQGQDMVNNATQLGEKVCLTTAPRGQEAIQKELHTLKDDWVGFSTAVNEVETNLEACISHWRELDDELTGFTDWIVKMESRVKGLQENKSDLARKQQLLHEGENILEDIVKNKQMLDKVRGRGDAVAQRSTDPRLSSNMMQLTTRYQALNTGAKNLVQKLGENVRDHKAYNEAFDVAANWLAVMDEKVQECNDTAGDWHKLQERMEVIKTIMARMDEGLQKVNQVCDLAEKILPNTSSEGKRLIEQQVTELTNEWEKLNLAITECNSMLEGVQERWNDYEEYYGSLVKWLADMENTLKMDPEPKAQIVEKKTQLDKYKLVLSDVDNHERLVNELAERVANLEALSENLDVADSLSDVQNRYDRVRTRAKELVSKLDRSYQEHLGFHEAQQESEKWLLQTSFRLMNHNSLNCSTMELTDRQIEKHRILLQEIEEYRSNLDRVNQKGRRLIDNHPKVPRLAQQIQNQLQNLEESYINLQATAQQIRDRLNDVLNRWQEYSTLLENTNLFLTGDFPRWLTQTDHDSPDSMQDAQHKLETVRTMWERLSSMGQELTNAAHRVENLGTPENADERDLPSTSPITQLASTVNEGMQHAVEEVERRLNHIREIIQQWESVDRMRGELRSWLHNKQEQLEELEQQPAKLHAEASELDIEKLQALREEIQARGPAVETLQTRYRELTEHNPSLQDPVFKAVKDDWEELLGQIENLITEREHALQAARDLQNQQNTMDEDLANYIDELEKIDKADMSVVEKSAELRPKRRKCRSTQTPNSSARFSSRKDLLGDSEDSDNDEVSPKSARHSGSSGPQSKSAYRRGQGGTPKSPSPRYRSLGRPTSRFDDRDLKKGATALESESEESGYGETYYTMHASSFDTNLDTEVFENTMRGTPLGLEANQYSDDDSDVSFIAGTFPPVNPEDLRDGSSQTPGHAGTQTPANMWSGKKEPLSIQTQTESTRNVSLQTSNTSLHSIGNQTRRSSGSRANLLRSLLSEVKEMKQSRGLNSTYTGSEDDLNSMVSGTTLQREMIQNVLDDVRLIKESEKHGTRQTQTEAEQGTQTSLKLFPEGDPVRNARLNRFQELMGNMRDMKEGKRSRTTTPSAGSRSRPSTRGASPMEHNTLAKFTPPNSQAPPQAQVPRINVPVQNGYAYAPQPMYNPQPFAAAAPPIIMNGPQLNPNAYPLRRRMITQDDLSNVEERIDRLRNYTLPPRRQMPPPPPPPPQYVIPIYATPAPTIRHRRPVFEDEYLSDESEYGGQAPRRRGRKRRTSPHVLNALEEASQTASHLKKLSQRMKENLRDDMFFDM